MNDLQAMSLLLINFHHLVLFYLLNLYDITCGSSYVHTVKKSISVN